MIKEIKIFLIAYFYSLSPLNSETCSGLKTVRNNLIDHDKSNPEMAETKSIIQKYFGKKIKIISPKKGNIDLADAFGEGEKLFLGISKGHFYLWVGDTTKIQDRVIGTRIEGAYIPLPSYKNQGQIYPGTLIHFPNVPPKLIENWRRKMGSRSEEFIGFSISCVSKACGVLQDDFDIRVKGIPGSQVFSSITLHNILKNGFKDKNNRPVPFQISRVNRKTPAFSNLIIKLAIQDIVITSAVLAIPLIILIGEDIFLYFEEES